MLQIDRYYGLYAQVPFTWVPWFLNNTAKTGLYGWLRLGDHCLCLNMGLEPDERLMARLGPLTLTRPETAQEQMDREEAEAEEAFMERELNRYTQWYY
ncbi:MAG: hypothetical protein ACO242_03590 [Candidatus Fonsibacter ubiquis]